MLYFMDLQYYLSKLKKMFNNLFKFCIHLSLNGFSFDVELSLTEFGLLPLVEFILFIIPLEFLLPSF